MHLRTLPFDKPPPVVRPRPIRRDLGELVLVGLWLLTMLIVVIGATP